MQQCYLWPRCKACKGLLRPHVVWFGEGLEEEILGKKAAVRICRGYGSGSSVLPRRGSDPGSQIKADLDLDSDLALLLLENLNLYFCFM